MNVKLLLTKKNGEIKEIPVKPGQSIIGRGQSCDIRVPIESCSREHCQISLDDQLSIADLESSNGTFVNNQRIDSVYLQAGDRITLGPVVLTVQVDGVPADPSTSPLETESAQAGDELIADDTAQIEELDSIAADDEVLTLDEGDDILELGDEDDILELGGEDDVLDLGGEDILELGDDDGVIELGDDEDFLILEDDEPQQK